MRKTCTICFLLASALFLIPGACKQSYVPKVRSANTLSLVVEGFINSSSDSTLIYLTRSFKLDDTSQSRPELSAQLQVQGQDNSIYPMTEIGNGQYGTDGLSLNPAVQYRLHILTVDGGEYVSDYTDIKTSPPIDSISWERVPGGVQIYANTHDPQNASHYYHWDYKQTWEFHAPFYSFDQYVNHQLKPRYADTFYTCWKNGNSQNILLTSTEKLSQDVVSRFPLTLIPPNSWMISVRYSILVKQVVVSKEEYAFWSDLKKNSEQIGSIFSPEPFQTRGNIHSTTDSSETVIGYIGAGTMQQLRIYITPEEISNWQGGSYDDHCEVDTIASDGQTLQAYLGGGSYLPLGPNLSPRGGELVASSICVDCTYIGTNVKPAFWP